MWMTARRFIFFATVFLVLFFNSTHAASASPLILKDKSSYDLSGHLEMLIDPTHKLSVEQAAQRGDWSGPLHGKALNLGLIKDSLWLRFSLENKNDKPRKFFVSFEYPVVNAITFYAKKERGDFQKDHTGSIVAASERMVPDRHFLFPVSLNPGETAAVYMHLRSSSGMTIPIRILSEQALTKKAIRDYTIYGALFGFLALIMVYFITAGSLIRQGISLWLALYSTFFGLHTAMRAGFIRLYMPDEFLAFIPLLQVLFIGGLFFTGAKFFRLFLSLKEHAKVLDKIMAGFQYLSLLFVALVLLPNPLLTFVSLVLFVINPFFSICLAFYFWHKGIANSGYFAMGWFTAHAVSVYDFFRINGIISYPFYNEWLIPLSLFFTLAFLSIALIKQNAAYHVMAGTDPLTGLANRRRFDEILHTEWNRCLRYGRPLSLILADVDRFKKYNDTFGHRAGDALLCRIAEILKNYTRRPGELAVRYGGEEFILILPNIDSEHAFHVAEAIRESVAAFSQEENGQQTNWHVTISMGVSTAIPQKEENPEKLVLEADKALYEAKHAGRNRTIVGSTPKA